MLPAATGAVILTAMWTPATVSIVLGHTVQGRPLPDDFPLNFHDWQGVLAVTAYAPLPARGPLLAAVTFAYHRRRTRTTT